MKITFSKKYNINYWKLLDFVDHYNIELIIKLTPINDDIDFEKEFILIEKFIVPYFKDVTLVEFNTIKREEIPSHYNPCFVDYKLTANNIAKDLLHKLKELLLNSKIFVISVSIKENDGIEVEVVDVNGDMIYGRN
jgi:hypothetical protein